MAEQNEEQDNRGLYAVLNLSPEASDEEIRRAYRQWAQLYHPDKYQSPNVCIVKLSITLLFPLRFAISSLPLFYSIS